MNKTELISAVAEQSGLSKIDTRAVVDSTLDVIASELAGGGDVSLTGFGTFGISERAARKGRNPANGEPIQIAASRNAKFKAGKNLKDAVNV